MPSVLDSDGWVVCKKSHMSNIQRFCITEDMWGGPSLTWSNVWKNKGRK